MNFDSNPILYPKDDELNPTKDNGNLPCYPKEDGLNPFKAIVERINALESVTRNYGDSFETKQLTVSENAQIKNLNATEGTVNTLESTNATITTLNSTTSTVANSNVKNAEVEKLNVTENAQIKNLHATEGTVDTFNSTNCNIKIAQIENLHTKELTWDLPSIDVENAKAKNLNVTEGTVDTLNSTNATVTNGNIKNAEVEKLHAKTEIKVENLKTEEPILSNSVVGYDENGKIIPIKADYHDFIELIYPVGSLYWSSKSTNPSTLFGGTWVQIKDRFILACGDTYTSVDATGGASSVTLSVSNMPSHTHSFTPSGEVTSTFTGSSVTTSGMSANSSGQIYDTRDHNGVFPMNSITGVTGCFSLLRSNATVDGWRGDSSGAGCYGISINVSHTHTVTAKGTVSSSFKGYGGTTSPEGSGTSFSILPPYVVKYCWERTA